jgi:uroporphyrinogen-III synthase
VKLLILRPQPGADATARRIREAGFEPVVMPLFAIEPLPFPSVAAADYDALLLTSGNAVRAIRDNIGRLATLPLYAVGTATARAVAGASLVPKAVGSHGVDALILAAKENGHRNLLWLTGEDYSEPHLPAHMRLDIRFVYRSAKLQVPGGFEQALAGADVVMLHSSRAAEYFAEICARLAIARADITLATFSHNIADSAGSGWADIIVAPAPNDAALLPEVQRRFTSVTRDP